MAQKQKYEGWVLLMTIVGSLAVVAAIAIAEGFIPQADLVLTQGEWEILAIVLYLIAILVWVFGGETRSQRATSAPPGAFLSLRGIGKRRLRSSPVGESPRAEIERTMVWK